MTDNYYKALGLPDYEAVNQKIEADCNWLSRNDCLRIAKWHNEIAASRIKEVAADHNEWILKREGLIRGEYTDGQLTWWDDQTQRSYTKTALFDLFIKERSGE